MAGEPLHVLLIRSWITRDGDVRDALRAGGYEPIIERADFEAAIAAALPRAAQHVVILDSSSGIPRTTIEQLMRDLRVWLPLVELGDVGDLVTAIRAVRAALRN